MRFTHAVRYDAPVADVHTMLTDPAFREKASWSQRVESVEVQVEGSTVRIEMVGWDQESVVGAAWLSGER